MNLDLVFPPDLTGRLTTLSYFMRVSTNSCGEMSFKMSWMGIRSSGDRRGSQAILRISNALYFYDAIATVFVDF